MPQLRLEGFADGWGSKHLGDVVSVVGGGTPSTAEPAFWGGNIDWFSPSEIGDESVAPRSRTTITAKGLTKSAARLLPAGRTVLFTSRASIGHTAILQHEAATNQGFQSLVVGADADVNFIHAITPAITDYALTRATGSTFLEVSGRTLREMGLHIPSLQEQRQIGSLFSHLDSLLSQHRRKHQRLQQTKTALMQRMFPRRESDEPVLRFEGSNAKWETGPLLDVIQSIGDFRGRTPKKLGLEWADSGHLALSANNVKQGHIDFARDPHYGDDELYEKWMAGRELHKGQVLFTTEAPMGNVAQVPDSRKYILSQRVIAFEVAPNRITEGFLRVLLGSPAVFAQLTSFSSGGTAQGVSQRSLAQVTAAIPKDLEEQTRIAAMFAELDSLISAELQFIDKLHQVKTGLIQKMFI